jgi:hypothetical protein
LARHPKDLDKDKISTFIKDKVILITGAGGSIGSEISRQCEKFGAKELILLDHSEFNLYTISQEIQSAKCIMHSVVNKDRLRETFRLYKPDIVIHAAAYKHVPLVEENIYDDTNIFLNYLKTKDIKPPKKTRDIYFYLPNRMLNIYPTITLFSNLDLMNGQKRKQPFFFKSTNIRENKIFIDLGRGIGIDKRDSTLVVSKQKVAIKRFIKTSYDNNAKLSTQTLISNPNGTLNVVFMSNYRQFLVVDDTVYNSLYFQLFVLENYNKELFEPTMLTPLAKVYKLKI